MLGSHDHIGRPKQRIGTCRENADIFIETIDLGLKDKLPPIKPSDESIGFISKELVEIYGFSPDCTVDAGSGDNMYGAIGTGNVGLLLDTWHLYTSGGSNEDLGGITANDVVTVHVNDAPAGVARDDQVDSVRRLPMETGVIDLPDFLRRLDETGYNGPVTPEPFSQRINAIAAKDPLEAAQVVSEHMSRLWQASGLV